MVTTECGWKILRVMLPVAMVLKCGLKNLTALRQLVMGTTARNLGKLKNGAAAPPYPHWLRYWQVPKILYSFQSLYFLCFETFSSFFLQFRFYFLFFTFSPFFIFIDILFRLLGYEPYATLRFDKLISIKPRENPKDSAKPDVASVHPHSYANLNEDGEPLPGAES